MFSKNEILQFALENGMIDESTIQEKMIMNERRKFLEMHENEIWQGSDGKWRTYLPDEEKGRKLLKRTSEEKINNAIIEFYKKRETEPTIEYVFNAWVNKKIEYGEIKKQTYDRYHTDFDRFFVNNEKFKNFSKRKIKYINEDDIEDFIKTTIAHMKLTYKAYCGMRILINGIFKYAKKQKWSILSITHCMGDIEISHNSFKKNLKSKETEVYQEEEAKRLTQYLTTQRNNLRCQGLLLIFETGLRIGELCGLKPEDVGKKRVRVRRTEVKVKDENGKWMLIVEEYTKTDAGYRDIIITEKAEETLKHIMQSRENGEFLFTERDRRTRSNRFREKLQYVCRQLGIDYKSNHKIRKTYGTTLIDGNVDDSIVAEQMGHADVTTTKEYYYYSNKAEDKRQQQIERAIGW